MKKTVFLSKRKKMNLAIMLSFLFFTSFSAKNFDQAKETTDYRENFTEGADEIGLAPEDTNKAILDITAEYERINNLEDLEERVFVSNRGQQIGNGDITYFYEGSQLVKIMETVTYAESCGNEETIEYYYKNGKLFFAYDSDYNCDDGEGKTVEYSSYFYNNNLILKKKDDEVSKIKPQSDSQKIAFIAQFYKIKSEKEGGFIEE